MLCPICKKEVKFRIEANSYKVVLGCSFDKTHCVEVATPLEEDDKNKVFYLLSNPDKGILINKYAPELIKKWGESFR